MAALEAADTPQGVGLVDSKSTAVHTEHSCEVDEKGNAATDRYAHLEAMCAHTNTTIDTVLLLSELILRLRRGCV